MGFKGQGHNALMTENNIGLIIAFSLHLPLGLKLFFLKAMGALIWNRPEYFYIVWQCNDICNTVRKKNIYILEFLGDVAGQAGDADSSQAPGFTPGSWTEPGVLECQ